MQPYNSCTYHVGPYVGPLFQKFAFIRDYVGLEMVMQITTKYDYVNFG